MKSLQEGRYDHFGGIEAAFDAFREGSVTIKEISKFASVTPTAVTNNFISAFGLDAYDEAREYLQQKKNHQRLMEAMQTGQRVKVSIQQFKDWMKSQDEERFSYKAVLEVARASIGEINNITFSKSQIVEVSGNKGSATVRFVCPKKSSNEYKINRVRLKITPSIYKESTVGIFVVAAKGKTSYYVMPSEEVRKVKSLNLKFEEQDSNRFKYKSYLKKVVVEG